MEVFTRSLLDESTTRAILLSAPPVVTPYITDIIGPGDVLGGKDEGIIALEELLQKDKRVQLLVDIAKSGDIINSLDIVDPYGYIIDDYGKIVARIDSRSGLIELPHEISLTSIRCSHDIRGKASRERIGRYTELVVSGESECPRISAILEIPKENRRPFIVSDGHHRLRVNKLLKRKTISAWVDLPRSEDDSVIIPIGISESGINRVERLAEVLGIVPRARKLESKN